MKVQIESPGLQVFMRIIWCRYPSLRPQFHFLKPQLHEYIINYFNLQFLFVEHIILEYFKRLKTFSSSFSILEYTRMSLVIKIIQNRRHFTIVEIAKGR